MGSQDMAPMGMQAGGEVDAMPSAEQAAEQLLMARETAEDSTEKAQAEKMIRASEIASNNQLAELAAQISAAGRGPDTTLAHLTPGEVVLPPEMMESAEFETAVENRFRELDLNPEQYVVGMGIASLNPQTGLEEFGFFKKLGKSIKKFAKKIAPVAGPLANFIPGVGPIVAGAIGAATNVVGGKGLKGALSGALGGYGTGKLIGGIGGLSGTTGKAFTDLGPIGKIQKIFSGAKSGIGSLFGGGLSPGEQLGALAEGNNEMAVKIAEQLEQGLTPEQVLQSLSRTPGIMPGGDPRMMLTSFLPGGQQPMYSDPYTAQQFALMDQQQQPQKGIGSFLSGLIRGGGLDDKGNFGLLGDVLGGAKNFLGTDTGKMIGGGGIAALLGKLAYDEARNRRGVPRTPLTTMDAMGRFNIEQEVARRMGKGDVDPREFGLMARGTIPTLSGGRKRPEREYRPHRGRTSGDGLNQAPAIMMNGGPVMAFAEGGGVAAEDFKAMDGKINGPGTETSDDIPAMLSDGEFVMKAQAVRGAGAFDLKEDGGIITLTPGGKEDREKGTKIMYRMMSLMSDQARAS